MPGEDVELNIRYKAGDSLSAIEAVTNALRNMDGAADETKTSVDGLSASGKVLEGALAVGGLAAAANVLGDISRGMRDVAIETVQTAANWESLFTGVRKTVDGTESQFASLEGGLRDLAVSTGLGQKAIAEVAESAGQLGIPIQNIEEFTKVMATLGQATDLSAGQAADAIARINNVMSDPALGGDQFKVFGAALVALGNTTAATESEIVNFATRLAGAGTQANITQTDVLAISASLASVGLAAESGGTAVSRLVLQMKKSAETNDKFAATFDQIYEASGKAVDGADTFAQAFQKDAAGALDAFFQGLNNLDKQGISTASVLEKLDVGSVRMIDAILRASSAAGQFGRNLATARKEAAEVAGGAIGAAEAEFNKRQATFEQAVGRLKAAFTDIRTSIGSAFLPIVKAVAAVLESVAGPLRAMANAFAALPTPVHVVVAAIGALTAAAAAALSGLAALGAGAGGLVVTFKALGGVFPGVVSSISGFGGTIGKAVAGMEAAKVGATVATQGLLALKVGAVGAAVVVGATLGKQLTSTGDKLLGFNDAVSEGVAKVPLWKGALSLAGDVLGILSSAVKSAVEWVKGFGISITDIVNGLRLFVPGLDASIKAVQALGKFVKFAGEQIAITASLTGKWVEQLGVVQKFYQQQAHAGEDAALRARLEQETLAKATAIVQQQTGDTTRVVTDYGAALRIVGAEAKRYMDAQKGIAAETDAAFAAAADATAETLKLAEAQKILNALSAEALKGFKDTKENRLALVDAVHAQADAEKKVDDIAKAFIETQKKATEAARDRAKEVEKLSLTMQGLQEPKELSKIEDAIAKAGGAAKLSQAAIEQYGASLSTAEQAGQKLGPNAQAVVQRFGELQAKAIETERALKAFNEEMERAAATAARVAATKASFGIGIDAGTNKQVSELQKQFGQIEEITGKTFSELGDEAILRFYEAAKQATAGATGGFVDIGVSLQENMLSALTDKGKIQLAVREISENLDQFPNPFTKMGQDAIEVVQALYGVDAATAKAIVEQIKLQQATNDTTEATQGWGEAVQFVTDLMEALGISAESTLGRILGTLGGITSGFQGLVQGLGKLGVDAGTGFLGGLSSIVSKAGIVGQVASAAIGIGGAIVGLFKSDPVKKAQKEAGKVLGEGISRELAEQIKDQADKLGIAVKDAALLSIGDVVEESGKTFNAFGDQILLLQQRVADGTVPMKEGLEAVGEAWAGVRDEAEKAGRVGDVLTRAMIAQARATGTLTDDMKDFLKEQTQLGAEGAGLLAGLIPTTEAEGKALAGNFLAAFQAGIEDLGLVGAADAFRDQFEAVRQTLADSLGEGLADEVFAPIAGIFDLTAPDSPFRGAAEAADGLSKIVESLANTGRLTQEQFTNFGISAQNAFNQATAAGADQRQAIEAVLPYLQSAVSAAEQYGYSLDANTQALVDQAKAAGFAFPTDPVTRMANAVELLVTGLDKAFNLGLDLPDAFGQAATAATGAATAATAGINAQTQAVATGLTTNVPPAAAAASQSIQLAADTATTYWAQKTSLMSKSLTSAIGSGASDATGSLIESANTVTEHWTEQASTIAATLSGDLVAAGQTAALGISDAMGIAGDESALAVDQITSSLERAITGGFQLAGAFDAAAIAAGGVASAAGSIPGSIPTPTVVPAGGVPPGGQPTPQAQNINVNTNVNLTINDNPFNNPQTVAEARRKVVDWAGEAFREGNADLVRSLPGA